MFQRASVMAGDYDHHYSKDPAFDQGAEDYDPQKWLDTRDDKHLPRKDGCRPVRFVLRRLTPEQRAYISDSYTQNDSHNMSAYWAIAMSLTKIDPMPEGDFPEWGTVKKRGFSVLNDEWMAIIQSHDTGGLCADLYARILLEVFGSPRG